MYLGFAVMGELSSDGAKVYWLLLLMVLHLPLTFWLYLVLAGLVPLSKVCFLCPGLLQVFWEDFRLLGLQRSNEAVVLHVAVLLGGF